MNIHIYSYIYIACVIVEEAKYKFLEKPCARCGVSVCTIKKAIQKASANCPVQIPGKAKCDHGDKVSHETEQQHRPSAQLIGRPSPWCTVNRREYEDEYQYEI